MRCEPSSFSAHLQQTHGQNLLYCIQREPIAIHENNAEKESEGRGAGQGDGRRWAGTHQRQQRNHAIPGPLKFLQYLRGLL